ITSHIHRQITEMQEEYEKPIYVTMGSSAASGGYYVSAPADKIFAEPSTLTGSIGVIMQSINFGGFLEKHGVDFMTIKRDRKSTRLNSSHVSISYAVFCLKKKKKQI